MLPILKLHKERSFYNSLSFSVTIITTEGTEESQSQPFCWPGRELMGHNQLNLRTAATGIASSAKQEGNFCCWWRMIFFVLFVKTLPLSYLCLSWLYGLVVTLILPSLLHILLPLQASEKCSNSQCVSLIPPQITAPAHNVFLYYVLKRCESHAGQCGNYRQMNQEEMRKKNRKVFWWSFQ